MKRIVLLTVLGLLAVVGSAQAHTTIIEPPGSHFPYQRWVDEAKVPTPGLTFTVIEAPCPDGHAPGAACAFPDEEPIYMDLALLKVTGWPVRQVFLHELGHKVLVPPWARIQYRKLLNGPSRPWYRSGDGGEDERFANGYMSCALGPIHWFDESQPDERFNPRVCSLIRRILG